MSNFNKATAATLSGAVVTAVGALWVDVSPELLGAIQTIITAVLVFAVPNKV